MKFACLILNMQLTEIQQSVLKNLAKYGNLILIGALSLVLMMMILPMSPHLLDLLLAINIVGTITLLIVSISVADSMKIASFPTLLLVATLFRLGLNIASTRLILTKGFAGDIIQTFGHFVTGGNMLIGFIIFLILTLIQYIVITKGAERVAEVSARFTLDAMPGKQMSIDADLRSGLLTQEEAQKQRQKLHLESKMFGSMDGAMKFVKGDAIASIVITSINILGGLITGVIQYDLTANQALNTYSILTIGDGLVTQIPALLISVTAGLVVTRVADETKNHSLGVDIGYQIFSQPKALLIASFLALLVGMIPGFPLFAFTLLAAILALFGIYFMTAVKKKLLTPLPVEGYMVTSQDQYQNMGRALPLTLQVGPELFRIFQEDPRWTHCLGNLYPQLKMHLSNQMGVLFPDLKLTLSHRLAQTFKYHVKIFEVFVEEGILTPKHCSYLGETKILKQLEVTTPLNQTETIHGSRVALWELGQKKHLVKKGLNIYGPEEMLLRHLAYVLKRHASDFVGIQEVKYLLNMVESSHPELVHEVVPKMMSVQKLTDIIKRLVEEGIPIKDFRLILEILSMAQPETKDPVTLTEQVRMGLKRTLTMLYTVEGKKLPAVTIDRLLEDEIREAIQKNGAECYLALPPERLQVISQAFKECFYQNNIYPSQCVILTSVDIRRYTRKIIEEELPDTPVLSFQELDPRVGIEERGIIFCH